MFEDVLDMQEDDEGNYQVEGVLDDVVSFVTNTGREVVDTGKDVVADRGAGAVEDMLRSSAFGKVLDAVELKAQEAVVKEVSKNALALFALAVSGGAIGGAIFKGKYGMGAAGGLVIWSMWMLTKAPTPPNTKPPVRK